MYLLDKKIQPLKKVVGLDLLWPDQQLKQVFYQFESVDKFNF